MASLIAMSIVNLCIYLIKVMPYLQSNASRLGVDTDKLDAVVALYGTPTTVSTYQYCKKQWDESSKRKDSIITQNLADVSIKMKESLIDIYNDIPASKWNNTDREKFERKTGLKRTHVIPTAHIAEKCVIEIEVCQNALFKIMTRFDAGSKYHAIPDSANAIEVRYAVVVGKCPITPEVADKVKTKCTGPLDGTTTIFSTTAKFPIQLDEILAGYDLYIWFRYTDIQHPTLAGEWSVKLVRMIL